MGIAELSRARVEDLLSAMEEFYDSFPVNQRTVALPGERYEHARAEYTDRSVDTYVQIENDEGDVLHLTGDEAGDLPGVVGDPEGSLEAKVAERVERQTGVDFAIDGVAEVTIAGISNADDPDAPVLYRLMVVFDASYEGGEPAANVEWRGGAPEPTPTYV